MNKRTTRLNPIERAVIAAQWTATTVDANIHALIGSSEPDIANKCGKVFFVALAIARQNCPDSPEARIMQSTMNALYEMVGTDHIAPLARQSIISGLQAASRVYRAASYTQIVHAACDLELKLRQGDVRITDFELQSLPA